jgi:hypothetical protein
VSTGFKAEMLSEKIEIGFQESVENTISCGMEQDKIKQDFLQIAGFFHNGRCKK